MTESTKKQIYKAMLKAKMSNGKTIEQNLQIEAKRLEKLIRDHMVKDALLEQPELYAFRKKNRTGLLENSLKIDATIRYTGKRFEVSVYFDNDANRASGYGVWNKNPHGSSEVNLPLLLNNGYAVTKDVWFKEIENFGKRDASHFLEKAIEDFNKQNGLGIVISYSKNGNSGIEPDSNTDIYFG